MKNEEPTGALTQAEKQRLVERHVELMERRKLEEDYCLVQAIKAAQVLARAKDG